MAYIGEMQYLTIGNNTYSLPTGGGGGGGIDVEVDPVFSASPAAGITAADITNWNGKGSGTVTSVGVANATNGGLSVSGSPITSNGTITIGHSNVLSSAQTTQAVYPIKIDKNGHISAYGSAVTIPTKTSDLTNDSGFITNSSLNSYLEKSYTNPDATYAGGGTVSWENESGLTAFRIYSYDNYSQSEIGNDAYFSLKTGAEVASVRMGAGNTILYLDPFSFGFSKDQTNYIYLNNNGLNITGLVTPTNNTDAATKKYVDDSITDTKVTQTVDNTTNSQFSMVFSSSNSTATEELKKTSKLNWSPASSTLVIADKTIGSSSISKVEINPTGVSLYNSNNYYARIALTTGRTSSGTLYLPDKTGTVALTSDISDEKVKQTAITSTSAVCRVLLGSSSDNYTGEAHNSSTLTYTENSGLAIGDTSSVYARYAKDGITFTRSSAGYYKIAIPESSGSNKVATFPEKTGTIAFTDDIPTVPTITLNGSIATSPSFYAPTTAGTSGYVLKSNGSGAPTWTSAVLTDTKNTAGSTNSTSQLYLIGATSQAANPQTYSNVGLYFNNGIYSETSIVSDWQSSISQEPGNITLSVNGDSDYYISIDWTDGITIDGVTTPTKNAHAANKKYVDDNKGSQVQIVRW